MKKMMKQMGMETEEIDSEEVVIIKEDEEIHIKNPEVNKINMMGTETYQITGEEEVQKREMEIPDGDNDENDVCYKRIRGHCLTYEDYLYYKQHTNQNNIAINNTNTDDSEEKESFELKEFIKDNIWLIGLFIGLIFLTLLFILYLYQTDKLY